MTDPPQRPNESDNPVPKTRSRPLPTTFEDVTGTTEVVAEQESPASARDIDEATTALSEYVQTVMTNDGLGDSIDEPEMGPT